MTVFLDVYILSFVSRHCLREAKHFALNYVVIPHSLIIWHHCYILCDVLWTS